MGRPPLLPLNGFTAAYMALPTLIATFAKHYSTKAHDDNQQDSARQELGFDEAFALAKFLVGKTSQYTVEEMQRFGNAFVPAPWRVRVIRVSIPSSTCSLAAQYLINAFGPDELQHVVGGQLWWQRRAHKDGQVQGEWIAMKSDWDNFKQSDSSACSSSLTHPTRASSTGDANNNNSSSSNTPNEDADQAKKKKSRSVLRQIYIPKQWSPLNPNSSGTPPTRQMSVLERVRRLPIRLHKPSNSPQRSPSPSGPTAASSAPSPDPAAASSSYSNSSSPNANNHEATGGTYEGDMDTMRCMLYIHGGAYYFGSVNTHRYSIWRYARKMGGRAFAVNYRLAPQYPFPCALVDCLAAYLYLIRPPPEAKHRPVDPSKVIIAGDSAGGGLSLALLLLIRDCGLPSPAGAVLISPWVDLTHSFPSVINNTQTDIIPRHGFMHQPSTLWPPPAEDLNPVLPSREASSPSAPAPVVLTPEENPKLNRQFSVFRTLSKRTLLNKLPPMTASETTTSSQKLLSTTEPHSHTSTPADPGYVNPYKMVTFQHSSGKQPADAGRAADSHPVVHIEGKKIVIDQQVQLYATNDQLTHPYCSPAFAPSLGGLPPLYIMAGDGEVLRDEIIYVAHRAAHPERYPLREELANAHPARKTQASLYPPTKVHLQVYDDMCHVLPLFSFARPAKYCYRAIASFCKFVTADLKTEPKSSTASDLLSSSALSQHLEEVMLSPSTAGATETGGAEASSSGTVDLGLMPDTPLRVNVISDEIEALDDSNIPHASAGPCDGECLSARSAMSQAGRAPSSWGRVTGGSRDTHHSQTSLSYDHSVAGFTSIHEGGDHSTHEISAEVLEELKETIYHASLPFNRPDFVDNMIRERVDIRGKIRPMEREEDIEPLKIDPTELGVIKEGPIKRWDDGRQIWDRKFMKQYKKIQSSRDHHIKRAAEEHKKRSREGRKSMSVMMTKQKATTTLHKRSSSLNHNVSDSDALAVLSSSQWLAPSPLSILERPPPSSLAARKDTTEARQLARAVNEQAKKTGHAYEVWSGPNTPTSQPESPPALVPDLTNLTLKAPPQPSNSAFDTSPSSASAGFVAEPENISLHAPDNQTCSGVVGADIEEGNESLNIQS